MLIPLSVRHLYKTRARRATGIFCLSIALISLLNTNVDANTHDIGTLALSHRDAFVESWEEERPVSSIHPVGIIATTTNLAKPNILQNQNLKGQPINLALYVFLPSKPKYDTVDISITTIDTRYSAKGHYLLTNARPGWNRVEFPTKRQSKLSQYRDNHVAILAEASSRKNSSDQQILLASWNKPVCGGTVRILLNSLQESLFLLGYDGKKTRKRCRPITAKTRTAYDVECILNLQTNGPEQSVFIQETSIIDPTSWRRALDWKVPPLRCN